MIDYSTSMRLLAIYTSIVEAEARLCETRDIRCFLRLCLKVKESNDKRIEAESYI